MAHGGSPVVGTTPAIREESEDLSTNQIAMASIEETAGPSTPSFVRPASHGEDAESPNVQNLQATAGADVVTPDTTGNAPHPPQSAPPAIENAAVKFSRRFARSTTSAVNGGRAASSRSQFRTAANGGASSDSPGVTGVPDNSNTDGGEGAAEFLRRTSLLATNSPRARRTNRMASVAIDLTASPNRRFTEMLSSPSPSSSSWAGAVEKLRDIANADGKKKWIDPGPAKAVVTPFGTELPLSAPPRDRAMSHTQIITNATAALSENRKLKKQVEEMRQEVSLARNIIGPLEARIEMAEAKYTEAVVVLEMQKIDWKARVAAAEEAAAHVHAREMWLKQRVALAEVKVHQIKKECQAEVEKVAQRAARQQGGNVQAVELQKAVRKPPCAEKHTLEQKSVERLRGELSVLQDQLDAANTCKKEMGFTALESETEIVMLRERLIQSEACWRGESLDLRRDLQQALSDAKESKLRETASLQDLATCRAQLEELRRVRAEEARG